MAATLSLTDKLKKSKLGKRTFFSTKKKGGVATYPQEPSPSVFPTTMPTPASDPNPILSRPPRESSSVTDSLESYYEPDMVIVRGISDVSEPQHNEATPSLALPVVLSQVRNMFAGSKLDDLFVNADSILKFSNKDVAYALYLAYNANDRYLRDSLLNTITQEDLIQFLDDVAQHPETALLFKKAVLAFFDAHLFDRYAHYDLSDAPRASFPSKLTDPQRDQLVNMLSEYGQALEVAAEKVSFDEVTASEVSEETPVEELSESERAFQARLVAALQDERFRTYYERYFAPLDLEHKEDALQLLLAYYSTSANTHEILGSLPIENATRALDQLESRSGHIQNEFTFFKNFILNHYQQAHRPVESTQESAASDFVEAPDETTESISEQRLYEVSSFVENLSDAELRLALDAIQSRLQGDPWHATELPVEQKKIRPPRLKRRILIRF